MVQGLGEPRKLQHGYSMIGAEIPSTLAFSA